MYLFFRSVYVDKQCLSEDLGVDGGIMLEWILGKQEG